MANGGDTIYRLSDLPANVENKFVDSGGTDWIIADADTFSGGINLSYNEPDGAATNARCSGLVDNATRLMSITGAIENARGSNLGDAIMGNTLDNILYGDLHATGPGGDDWIMGLDGNDTVYGGGGDDVVYGGKGEDDIRGGAGDDSIYGAQGNDELTGGGGKDDFYFDFPLKNNVDRITDFDPGDDTFQLDRGIFHALKSGALPESQFVANGSGEAETKNQRIIYETDTGKLYYDSDGTGHHDRVQFAVVDRHLHLTHSDFYA